MTLENANFTHQCLIAMPAMDDPRFAQSLTYIIKHDEEGAVGLIVNRPLPLHLDHLLKELESAPSAALQLPGPRVLFGGPVSTQMGFVLHREEGHWNSTLPVADGIYVTSSRDILDAIAQGQGPDEYLVALGYAGWAPGQLEEEMGQNAWLTCDADADLLFNLPFEQRWHAGIHKLGIDPAFLASEAGHA
ncbi:MAG: YqgE/AlgH family protein [Moraxellaceae bacterium]|jgi:putative transcriptional regulator|nr:YqgE/AlgH family protein [Moraxellaceae bacterium]HQV41473.1 YqgE/AlgH family protein [Moraxellaceae bacterium]HQX89089.1 YqgE/AlgH family protein [Moraxellaceae bacterium]